jgi:hypothetical protein
LRIPAKSKRTCSIRLPTTSMRFRSRVPMPASSASFIVLSQVSNGGVPRSAIGSKFITAMHTASVVTGFLPATITPGFTTVLATRAHGPSPPVIVTMPSTMARSMGRAATRSTTTRGTR